MQSTSHSLWALQTASDRRYWISLCYLFVPQARLFRSIVGWATFLADRRADGIKGLGVVLVYR